MDGINELEQKVRVLLHDKRDAKYNSIVDRVLSAVNTKMAEMEANRVQLPEFGTKYRMVRGASLWVEVMKGKTSIRRVIKNENMYVVKEPETEVLDRAVYAAFSNDGRNVSWGVSPALGMHIMGVDTGIGILCMGDIGYTRRPTLGGLLYTARRVLNAQETANLSSPGMSEFRTTRMQEIVEDVCSGTFELTERVEKVVL